MTTPMIRSKNGQPGEPKATLVGGTNESDRPIPSDPRIYRLHVALDKLVPPIWRRLEVCEDEPINFVDSAIRVAFGWSWDHASRFEIKGRHYGTPTDWLLDRETLFMKEERRIIRKRLSGQEERAEVERLSKEFFGGDIYGGIDSETEDSPDPETEEEIPFLCELVPRVRTKFRYRYDFGDCWDLSVRVEKIEPAQPGVSYPRCIDGARAHPIEDCGGVWSHAEFIEAAGDPKHSIYPRLIEWVGPRWDPEQFSSESVNKELRKTFPNS